MSKTESTSQLKVEKNFPANAQSRSWFLADKHDERYFLSPHLKKLRALLPQSYLLPRTYGVDNPFNKIFQQANQTREINNTGRFFSTQSHQQGQKNKRRVAGNHFLSAVKASDVMLDMMEASLDIDIPAEELDAIIEDLYSDFCEPAQKKIKIESPQP